MLRPQFQRVFCRTQLSRCRSTFETSAPGKAIPPAFRNLFHTSAALDSVQWRDLTCSGVRCHVSQSLVWRASALAPKAAAVASTPPSKSSEQWWQIWKYWRVRLLLRGLRVAMLASALYNLGYQAGLQDCAYDPDLCRAQIIEEVTKSTGAVAKDGKPKLLGAQSPQVAIVERVFSRVLQAAIEEVRSQEAAIKVHLQEKNADAEATEALERLQKSLRMLENWSPKGFIVLDVDTPNAFVTPLAPKLVFIHKGLLNTEIALPVESFVDLEAGAKLVMHVRDGVKYRRPDDLRHVTFKKEKLECCRFVRTQVGPQGDECVVSVQAFGGSIELCIPAEDVKRHWTYSVCETDEQLAMVLSHELSHAIHDHGGNTTRRDAVFIGAQLVLLSLLDVTGLISMLAVIGMEPALKYSAQLPYSRNQEFEADSTGLRILARAEYDPKDAASFFERLDTFSTEVDGGSHPAWRSTHPATKERIERLRELEPEARKLYESSATARAKRRKEGRTTGALAYVLAAAAFLFGFMKCF